MKKISWLDELAFRLSYGYTGSIDKNALPFGVMTFMSTDEYFGYIFRLIFNLRIRP